MHLRERENRPGTDGVAPLEAEVSGLESCDDRKDDLDYSDGEGNIYKHGDY